MEKGKNFLRIIPFTEFSLWDVKRYNDTYSLKLNNPVFLRDILKNYRIKISKNEVKENNLSIISKINFKGKIFLRDRKEIKTYKGPLYKVLDDSIIYSKINVKHGCIYHKKKEDKSFAVSSEYPAFTFDKNKVDGDYLILVLSSDKFKHLFNSKTSGISKSRVKVDEFLDIKVPLPSIEEQKRIISEYNNKIHQAEDKKQQILLLEEDLYNTMDFELGITINQKKTKEFGYFLKSVQYKTLNKWGIDSVSDTKVSYSTNYKLLNVEELCYVSSGGTPSRRRKDYYNGEIPWIKTGEVINEVIFNTQEKITEEAIENSNARIYPCGSLIIAMYGQGKTRGRTAKIGVDASTNQACAVLYGINESLVLTDYLWIYLQNEYQRLRQMASGNSQPNLSAKMIKNYPVVIPPISKQKDIIEKIFSKQKKIKSLKFDVEKNIREALDNFELNVLN